MKYIPTIGLEIHAELKTLTKMFCDSLNDPEEKHPNQNVCPVCLGHPGTLPTINKQAVEAVIKVGLAMGGAISPVTKFDRKNYFYPDLPKGYQISQYDEPLVTGGVVDLKKTRTKIRLRRIHLEEDTGRLLHDTDNAKRGEERKAKVTLVDFNRAGVPLMELVTEPDFTSGEEVVEFAKYLQRILRYLNVSNADMEKGQMRVEANVSVGHWTRGIWKIGIKVELKNINSFKAVQEAIDYELKRQARALSHGEKVKQETRGWDDAKKVTFPQRSKEEAHDYRYFPEPDLPPFETKVFDLENLRGSFPELPEDKRERLRKEYGLSDPQLELLIDGRELANFFEAAVSELTTMSEATTAEAKKQSQNILFNYLTSDLRGLMNEAKAGFRDLKITPEHLAHLVDLLDEGKIQSRQAKDILRTMFEGGDDPENIMKSGNLETISGKRELETVIKKILEENPRAVADYKKGKVASLQFLIGKAMGRLRGRGNPEVIKEIFLTHLK